MNTPQHHPLTHALTREAEQFTHRGGTELDLAQVLDRAGEIQRGRRMRATMLMAACVLAIVAPVGIIALDHDRTRQEPTPAAPVRRTLTLEGLPTGEAPRTGYVQGRVWHEGTAQIPLTDAPFRVDSVVPLDVGYLVGAVDGQGRGWTSLVHPDGSRATPTWRSQGRPVVSPGGGVAAFVGPDGPVKVIDGRTAGITELPRAQEGAFAYHLGAIEGSSCLEGDGCSALTIIDHRTEPPETWRVSSDGSKKALPRITIASAVSKKGWVAGMTLLREDGSTCSEVQDAAGDRLWQTCQHTLNGFSADGRRLLAGPAYLDGAGVREVSVLDAATGRTVLDVQLTDRSMAGAWAWEDDEHVLVTVHEAGQWAVVRLGLDGSAEVAVPAVAGPEERPSFVLATR